MTIWETSSTSDKPPAWLTTVSVNMTIAADAGAHTAELLLTHAKAVVLAAPPLARSTIWSPQPGSYQPMQLGPQAYLLANPFPGPLAKPNPGSTGLQSIQPGPSGIGINNPGLNTPGPTSSQHGSMGTTHDSLKQAQQQADTAEC